MNAQEVGLQCVAIISPGEMGHAIAKMLVQDGLEVITCLKNRSQRTRSLAHAAGITDVESLERITLQADLILSILVPDQALDVIQEIAEAATKSGRCPAVADCNAISPPCVRLAEQIISDVGGQFIDASIIGFPPRTGQITRIYASGPHAHLMTRFSSDAIQVVLAGEQIGQASAIKMCYAAFTKGLFALEFAMLISAQRLNILDELCSELEFSQTDAYRLMQRQLPRLPAKSDRWVGEMHQIAATFDQVGVSPKFHQAAAMIYRSIANSSLARETPETIDEDRTLVETIREISLSTSR